MVSVACTEEPLGPVNGLDEVETHHFMMTNALRQPGERGLSSGPYASILQPKDPKALHHKIDRMRARATLADDDTPVRGKEYDNRQACACL